jgi:cell division septal protein FtsQ
VARNAALSVGATAALKGGMGLVVAAVLAVAVWQLFRLPLLTVTPERTTVVGSVRVNPEAIYAAAGIDGRSIFLIRKDAIRSALTSLEGIQSADVRLRLPNSVRLEVMELTPLVAWETNAGSQWLTADGKTAPQRGDLPLLRLIDPEMRASDENGALRSDLLTYLVKLVSLRPDLANEYYYGPIEGLYFVAPEGWTVYLGDRGDLAAKLKLLDSTTANLRDQGKRPARINIVSEKRAFVQ